MRSIGLLLFASLFGFITLTNAQNGSVGQPFTSLGQAQNVATDGVYYFSLSGTSFSTYVRVGGWVQVAIDFDSGVGNLTQSNALNNSVRGILTPTALSTLGSATVTRVLTSNGQLDVQNTRPGIITRIVNNQTLLATPADNTDNGGNWTGTNTLATQFTNAGNTQAYGLNLNIFHAGNNGDGIHWIPFYNQQMIKFSAGDIPNGAYFQLLVRAPMVAVVSGPVINTQPSTSAQSVCLNAAINALSVSATSPNGSGITYQWYSNASASNAGGTSIGGATSSSYTPPNNVVGTVYYYVICTNNQGSATSTVSAGITVNAIPQAAANSGSVDYLVVGGGGGGGFDGAGGGGGGQVKTGSISLASGSYSVTIGNGGANATGFGAQAGNGGSTTLSLPTPIVSIGGGGGGSKGANGATGGNGGGGGHSNYAGAAGAVGGFAGGNANGDGGGGGGGAGTAGATGSAGRNGGDGVLSSISGSATYYGGGGGGGSYGSTGTALGGLGGGGRGGLAYTPLAVAGTPNTGGGGGGAGEAQSNPGRSGGSGVVIVRYLGSPSGTGGTITQTGGYTIHTFNSNGTFAYNGSSSAVVPNVTVCGSTTATFTSTLAAGLTLDWYNAAIGGTLLSQGTSTYTTPVLASTTTYYVAVRNVSAGCVSATRTAVTATVNTTSFTSTTGASLCSTGTATLQAATAAGTINWYAASTGGASLGTGTSYTTPSIAATTTYYAEVTNNGCTTNPRVAVVASVNSTPPTPTITQSGCGVLSLGNYGGGNALDFGQFNSSSFITIPSSLNSVFNTNNVTVEGWFKFDANNVGFPMLIGEAYVGDGKITFAMYKHGNYINAGYNNNGWTLVTSASTIQINTWMHIAATYDQTSIKIYINGNLDATLNANAALPTGSESWYIGKRWDSNDYFRGVMDEIRIWNVARTQAQIQASMNTTVPTNATGLRAYYKLDESVGTSPADATGNGYNGTLTNGSIWQVPSTSILGASQATYLWSPGGQTTNTITAATSGTYSVVATLSGCQSASASSSVVLGVTASSNQTICSGTSPANLTLTGTAATIQWQSSSDNVNFTNIAGATSATLSSAQMGNLNTTTYYRAYATSAVCAPSYSNTVTLTVNTTPSFTSTTGASRCGTGTVTLQAATAAGTINWYAALTGGASLGTGTSFNTPSIAATTTYYAAVTNNGCTTSPRTAVVATVNAIPTFSATTGASICGTGTGTLQASTAAGTINWYAALTGGASLGTGTSYTTPSIATTTTYYADVTNNGCTTNPRVAVVATVNTIPPIATNSPSGLTIDILTVAGGGGAGYARGGGGGAGGYIYSTNVSYAAGTSDAITVGTGGSPGSDNAGTGVHATSGTNSSFGSTYIAIGGGGGGSYGGGPQNGYNGGSGGGGANQSSSANTGYGGTGTAGQGNAGGNSRCGGGGEVSGGGGGGAGGSGTHGTSNGCGSAANRPYNPGNGGNGLQNSISGTAVWYAGGGGGGGLGTSLNLQGTNGLGGGQASYGGGGQCKLNANNWVMESGGPGIVIVRYSGTPVATGGTITQVGGFTIHTFTTNGTFAFAGVASSAVIPNMTSCVAAAITFTGTVNAGYTLDWYNAASGGTLLSQGTSTYTTPVISTTTTYYVAVRNTTTGCVSATRTAVTATINTASFTSTTGASRCGTGTVTLQATTAAGTINWYAALTGGASLGTGTSYNTPSIATTTTYYADVTNNGCTSSPRTAVVATVNAIPTFSATTGASICGTGTVTLQAATAAGTINWYAALTGGASLGTGTSYTTPSIATTTTYYADVTNNGCTSSPRTAVVATVNAIPTFSATTGASRCGTGTVTLQAATAAGTINWYAALTGGASLGTGTSFNTPSIAATTTYYADVTNNGCTSSPRTAVVATVNTIPTLPSTTGASICGTGTATLQATTAAGTINWYAALTGGASLGTGTSYTTPSIATTTTYYVDVTDNGCTSSPRTAVVATVNALPTPTITQSGCGVLTLGNYGAGNALNLGTNNTSKYVSIPASLNASFNTNNITVEGWFNLSAYDPAMPEPMLVGEAYISDNKVTFMLSRYQNQIRAGYFSGSAWSLALSASSIPANTWTHIAATYDQTSIKIYINGVLDGTLNASSPLPTGNEVWYLGKRFGGPDMISGVMDEIRIWNVARTQAQIQAVMNTSVPTNSTGLRAYYKLDESAGTSTADATGNGHNGTLINGPTWQVPSTSVLAGAAATFLWSPGGQTTNTITAATNGTYTAVVTSAVGCQSAPVSANVVMGGVASSSQTVCPGLLPSAITLTNYGGTLQWQTSNDNVTFTNIAGQTSATLPANAIGIMAGTKYIRALVTNGGCVIPSNVVTLSPANVNVLTPLTASSYVWNGQSSSDWGTLSNWYSYNGTSLVPAATLPGSTANTVIPANTGCILTQPTLSSGAIIINSLVLETGSQLTQSGGTLLLYTNFVKNGNLNSTGGLINFYGPTAATISGSGAVQFTKMRVNKLAGATLTLQIPVTVSDSLTMILGNIYTTTNNLLTLGLNSASPGKLVYTNGTVVGPLKRFFANVAVSGLAGRFPVGTATYNRYAQFSFASSPGVNQSLTVNYASGAPLSGGNILYNGLPLWASNSLMQNYSADGYWNVIPTNNDYTSTINTAPYEVTLYANNLTGMQTPQVCRIIKSAGSNTAAQNHVAWSACGTHTAIAGGASPLAFLISSTASQGFSWFNIGTPNSQALPVEFAGMTTTCEEEAISIRWSTESEHNNDYFRIEKSTDGSTWDILGYVDAVGNSSVLNGYEFLDVEYRSNTYYRLYQVDQDGSEELLSTMYSDCNVATDEIASFPNPSDESFSIFWKQFNTNGDGTITIRDINGKTMHHETVALSLGANLFMIKAHLAPGVYMIELIDDNFERSLIKHVVK
jgi:hypothetical protein